MNNLTFDKKKLFTEYTSGNAIFEYFNKLILYGNV